MSDIRIDLGRTTNQEQAERLKAIIPSVGSVDTLNISIPRTSATEVDPLFSLLHESGFAVHSRGDEESYYIVARRIH